MDTLPALDVTYYDLLMEVSGALNGAMRAVSVPRSDREMPPPLLQLRGGYAESPGWFLVQAAEFAPEPLTVANLRVRDIYASEGIVRALLELLASERYLDHDGRGAYSLTAGGRALLGKIRSRRRVLLADLAPIPAEELARIAAWLGRLISASLAGTTPPGTWCLAHSRNRAPDAEAGPLEQIMQYLDDFNAFRDDAHMAAWQPLGVDGHVWEAFATIHAGVADSVETVFDQLTRRGFSRSEYDAALRDLARRGWLAADADTGKYAVTEDGRAVHTEAEERTDRYFYAPWTCLDDGEIAALHTSLIGLRAGLAAPGV